ncbi:zinc ribbon domain-containing protein [Macrococcus equi]|uniref:zinc ribbon domain-containing protein n=1 Tax=Macrococcus equi TaxID=3395462 RepID=UPI0039BDBBCF
MLCPKCQNTINPTDRFCSKCGYDTQKQDSPVQNSALALQSKNYFQALFSHDKEISSTHAYSTKLSLALIGAGILAIVILLLVLTHEVEHISPLQIIIKIIMLTAMSIGGTTYLIHFLVQKFTNQKIPLKKVLSDYVLINTFAIISILLAVVCFLIKVNYLPQFFFLMAILIFTVSPLYLLSKYISTHKTSIGSYYIILIFIVAQSFLMFMIGESIFVSVTKMTADFMQNSIQSGW